ADSEAKLSLAVGNLRPEAGANAVSIRRMTLLLSPNYRVAKLYSDVQSVNHAAEVLADLKAMFCAESPRVVGTQAPVLLVPDALPKEFCQELIQVWETQGSEDSGFMKQIEGKTVGMMDYSHKIRRDHFLDGRAPLTARVKKLMGDRVLPEI